jgi:arylsulfatase A-like enzyme
VTFGSGLWAPGAWRGRLVPAPSQGQLVSGVDLPVTFAAVAGVTPGRVTDGINMLPLTRREHRSGTATERVLPIEAYRLKGGAHLLYTGIRVGDRFTYARHSDGSEDLFDLVADPFELRSVDDDPAYADILAAARDFTAAFLGCAGAACQTDQVFPPAP